jgi:hypothetical protein
MTVINLEQWTVERLATQLEPRFKESGTLVAGVAEVGNVEWWRKAARCRAEGRPASSDHVVVRWFNGLRVPGSTGRARRAGRRG